MVINLTIAYGEKKTYKEVGVLDQGTMLNAILDHGVDVVDRGVLRSLFRLLGGPLQL